VPAEDTIEAANADFGRERLVILSGVPPGPPGRPRVIEVQKS